MKKVKKELRNGTMIKGKRNLEKELNYNFLYYTNKALPCGRYDFPEIQCDMNELPDYIALYSQPKDYHKTDMTAVSFFNYDRKFDSQHGLFNAIYYKNEKDLKHFKEKFKDIKIFFMPDYSVFGDIPFIENCYRTFKARIVSLWLTLENNSIVIPNISAGSERDFEYIFDGLKKVTVAGISTKGKLQNKKNRALLKETIDMSISNMPLLKAFVVYDITAENKYINALFKNAYEKGIKVVIPDNQMKIRNKAMKLNRGIYG